MTKVNLMLGDCLDKLKELDDDSVDSIVTDPPYGLSFMGKAWDKSVPSVEVWEECFRVLKPGGHLLAFAGTRTQHRMAVNIEDAGFEIRDMIAWVYGSGFPKSMNISKAIDAKILTGKSNSVSLSKNEKNRPVLGTVKRVVSKNRLASEGESESGVKKNRERFHDTETQEIAVTSSITDDAKKWEGWGTALKPALEPITVARKPISEKTVAANVLKHGTGAINIDESRVPVNNEKLGGSKDKHNFADKEGWDRPWMHDEEKVKENKQQRLEKVAKAEQLGRFPSNLIHDGSEEVVELFPNTKEGDGSASRFFYVPKTSKKDRNEGLENLPDKEWRHEGAAVPERKNRPFLPSKNNHPTVKPTDLMRYLVRMVTPKGGTTLDPFMGSGSTGKAAKLEGFGFIGIELDPDYLEIAKARIDAVERETNLEDFFE